MNRKESESTTAPVADDSFDAIPEDWLAEFEAAARRPLATRFRYAFIHTYKPVRSIWTSSLRRMVSSDSRMHGNGVSRSRASRSAIWMTSSPVRSPRAGPRTWSRCHDCDRFGRIGLTLGALGRSRLHPGPGEAADRALIAGGGTFAAAVGAGGRFLLARGFVLRVFVWMRHCRVRAGAALFCAGSGRTMIVRQHLDSLGLRIAHRPNHVLDHGRDAHATLIRRVVRRCP